MQFSLVVVIVLLGSIASAQITLQRNVRLAADPFADRCTVIKSHDGYPVGRYRRTSIKTRNSINVPFPSYADVDGLGRPRNEVTNVLPAVECSGVTTLTFEPLFNVVGTPPGASCRDGDFLRVTQGANINEFFCGSNAPAVVTTPYKGSHIRCRCSYMPK